MAEEQATVTVAKMHTIAPTITEILAVGTFVLAHPFAVAVGLEAIFPNFHEIVLIDVALMIVGTDAGAGGDAAINEHRPYAHTGLTGEEMVAHIALVVAQETLATIVHADASLLSGSLDEVEHAAELFVSESHLRIVGCSAYGEDTEDTPSAYPFADEIFLDVVEFRVVALVHTGDDVKNDSRFMNQKVNGLINHVETVLVATHPVVVVFQSVETEGYAMHASIDKRVETLWREIKAIAHHPPRETSTVNLCTTLFQVVAHQRLAAGNDHEHLVRIALAGHTVKDTQEIFQRHILLLVFHLTVASAMSAMQVTT